MNCRLNTRQELYLIGVTAIFIASKYFDYDGLKITILVDRIVCGEFSIGEIKKKELSILKAIEFDPDLPTTYEFIELLFTSFFCSHKELEVSESLEDFMKIKRLCTYFAVMCCYDYAMRNFESVFGCDS